MDPGKVQNRPSPAPSRGTNPWRLREPAAAAARKQALLSLLSSPKFATLDLLLPDATSMDGFRTVSFAENITLKEPVDRLSEYVPVLLLVPRTQSLLDNSQPGDQAQRRQFLCCFLILGRGEAGREGGVLALPGDGNQSNGAWSGAFQLKRNFKRSFLTQTLRESRPQSSEWAIVRLAEWPAVQLTTGERHRTCDCTTESL